MQSPSRPSLIGLLALLAIAALGGCSENVSDRAILEISPAEVAERLAKAPKGVVAVDARGAEAFAAGHLPNAVRLPLNAMGTDARSAPSAVRGKSLIVVYGHDPGSVGAIALTKRLMSMGVGDVRFMRAGFIGWRAQALPIEGAGAVD